MTLNGAEDGYCLAVWQDGTYSWSIRSTMAYSTDVWTETFGIGGMSRVQSNTEFAGTDAICMGRRRLCLCNFSAKLRFNVGENGILLYF